MPAKSKRCTRCGKHQPLDAFNLLPPRGAYASERRDSWCWTCRCIISLRHGRNKREATWLSKIEYWTQERLAEELEYLEARAAAIRELLRR